MDTSKHRGRGRGSYRGKRGKPGNASPTEVPSVKQSPLEPPEQQPQDVLQLLLGMGVPVRVNEEVHADSNIPPVGQNNEHSKFLQEVPPVSPFEARSPIHVDPFGGFPIAPPYGGGWPAPANSHEFMFSMFPPNPSIPAHHHPAFPPQFVPPHLPPLAAHFPPVPFQGPPPGFQVPSVQQFGPLASRSISTSPFAPVTPPNVRARDAFDDDSYDQIAEAVSRTLLSHPEEDWEKKTPPIAMKVPAKPAVQPRPDVQPPKQDALPQTHTHAQREEFRRRESVEKSRMYPPLGYLRGSFTNQIKNILNAITPPISDASRLKNCMDFLAENVSRTFPSASVHSFGSTACDMYLKGTADVDVCVVMDEPVEGSDLYREWKAREVESIAEFEKMEDERALEWDEKERVRVEELKRKKEEGKAEEKKGPDEEGGEKSEEKKLPDEIRVYRRRNLKAFSLAHFVLEKVSRVIEKDSRSKDTQLILNTRIPIIKLNHDETDLQVDIGFNNLLGVHNTRLISTYAKVDHRFKEMVLFIKYWAKRKTINDTYHGTLSSYAYVLMIIHYLQHACYPPVLPCLQTMKGCLKKEVKIDGTIYDVTFMDDLVEINRQFRVGANTETLGELIYGFYDYWSHKFDFKSDVASVRLGKILTKEEKDWVPLIEKQKKAREGEEEGTTEDKPVEPVEKEVVVVEPENEEKKMVQRYWMCLEDPFETEHNLGRPVGRDSLYFIRGEFLQATHLLGGQKNYSRDYMNSIRSARGENPSMAPNLAEKICIETQYKTREEHKIRNKENMDRKKDRVIKN